MSYSIKDEEGNKVRIVGRLEEAKALCALREGWTYNFFKTPQQEPIFYRFEEAPF